MTHIRIYLFLALLAFLLVQGCSPSRGIYHTVQPGQTLYRIGHTYGVDEKYLARLNGIRDPREMRAGEKIFIPGVAQRKHVPSSFSAGTGRAKTSSAPQRKPAAVKKSRAVEKKSSPTPNTAKVLPPKKIQAVAPKKGALSWPVKGRILRKFGQKSSGPSKGVEISASKGTSIQSAAAGQVIYSGNGIRGYGNLIIVQHENGLFTVYGYNDRNLVKNGTFVGKGDRIAAVGVPPGGGAPRLYFEVRQGKNAVNPLFYLP